MIKIRGSEANKFVLLALKDMGVNANKLVLKESDNNVKCFLFYEKELNGYLFEKVIQIESKNYLRLLSYGIHLKSKGEIENGFSLCRKNS